MTRTQKNTTKTQANNSKLNLNFQNPLTNKLWTKTLSPQSLVVFGWEQKKEKEYVCVWFLVNERVVKYKGLNRISFSKRLDLTSCSIVLFQPKMDCVLVSSPLCRVFEPKEWVRYKVVSIWISHVNIWTSKSQKWTL